MTEFKAMDEFIKNTKIDTMEVKLQKLSEVKAKFENIINNSLPTDNTNVFKQTDKYIQSNIQLHIDIHKGLYSKEEIQDLKPIWEKELYEKVIKKLVKNGLSATV